MNSTPAPIAQYLLTAVIAILGTVMTVLLGLILGRLGSLEKKLDNKVDKEFCDHQQAVCEKAYGRSDFWEVFNRHSHTGLSAESKVTR
jgi:uncharacterized membrane-anchored protein YhcB (DUF1043 family)